MDITIEIQEKPSSNSWNEIYYLLLGKVTISLSDGTDIFSEEGVAIVELDDLINTWAAGGIVPGREFRYEPDSYELNPMLAISPHNAGCDVEGVTPAGRRRGVVQVQEVSKLVSDLHKKVKQLSSL
jgi:hypothetical protein